MGQKSKIILILFFPLAVLFLSLPLIRSGLNYSYGLGFWGPSGHDIIWHLQLINHIRGWRDIPVASFSGAPLQNYHPFYDLLIAFLSHLTGINSSLLVFQIFPLISSAVLLYLSFLIGQKLTSRFSGGLFLVFLNTFAGSFGWIITLLRSGYFGGESLFWSMQSASFQTNPPLILSLVFIFFIIYQILNKKYSLLIILFLILLPITKAYGGVAGFLLWGFYSLFEFFKKNYRPFIYLFISFPLALFLFHIYNPSVSSLLQFSPFWFVENLFSSTDKLFIPKIVSAISTFKSTGNIKLIPLYIFGVIAFIIGNFGWRSFGFLKNKLQINKILLFSSIILIILPLLFIQKGTAWNTIQFMYYALSFGNILLLSFIYHLKNIKHFYLLSSIIVITSLLGNINTYQNYLGNPPPAAITSAELPAITFLNRQSPGIVLTYPFDDHLKDAILHTPIPLYAYDTNSYLTAYTHQNVFLADEMNLDNSGYNWQPRRADSLKFFDQKNIFQNRGFLVNNQIDYIYLTGLQIPKTNLDITNLYLTQIYRDADTIIYRVNR